MDEWEKLTAAEQGQLLAQLRLTLAAVQLWIDARGSLPAPTRPPAEPVRRYAGASASTRSNRRG